MRGATCRYSPEPWIHETHVTTDGGRPCDGPWGVYDRAAGGDTNNGAGLVKVLRLGPPYYVVRGCENGREMLALIRPPGSPPLASPTDLDPYATWVFPRFLKCP